MLRQNKKKKKLEKNKFKNLKKKGSEVRRKMLKSIDFTEEMKKILIFNIKKRKIEKFNFEKNRFNDNYLKYQSILNYRKTIDIFCNEEKLYMSTIRIKKSNNSINKFNFDSVFNMLEKKVKTVLKLNSVKEYLYKYELMFDVDRKRIDLHVHLITNKEMTDVNDCKSIADEEKEREKACRYFNKVFICHVISNEKVAFEKYFEKSEDVKMLRSFVTKVFEINSKKQILLKYNKNSEFADKIRKAKKEIEKDKKEYVKKRCEEDSEYAEKIEKMRFWNQLRIEKSKIKKERKRREELIAEIRRQDELRKIKEKEEKEKREKRETEEEREKEINRRKEVIERIRKEEERIKIKQEISKDKELDRMRMSLRDKIIIKLIQKEMKKVSLFEENEIEIENMKKEKIKRMLINANLLKVDFLTEKITNEDLKINEDFEKVLKIIERYRKNKEYAEKQIESKNEKIQKIKEKVENYKTREEKNKEKAEKQKIEKIKFLNIDVEEFEFSEKVEEILKKFEYVAELRKNVKKIRNKVLKNEVEEIEENKAFVMNENMLVKYVDSENVEIKEYENKELLKIEKRIANIEKELKNNEIIELREEIEKAINDNKCELTSNIEKEMKSYKKITIMNLKTVAETEEEKTNEKEVQSEIKTEEKAINEIVETETENEEKAYLEEDVDTSLRKLLRDVFEKYINKKTEEEIEKDVESVINFEVIKEMNEEEKRILRDRIYYSRFEIVNMSKVYNIDLESIENRIKISKEEIKTEKAKNERCKKNYILENFKE